MGENFTSQYSAASPLLGSEDPFMIKESEDLLTQFMRCTSHDSQDALLQSQRAQGLSADSVAGISSSRTRVKIPRGNVQLRPESSQQAAMAGARASVNPGPNIEEEIAPRISRRKSPTPLRRRTPQSLSPASDVPKPALVRRSARSRAGPTNYYKKTYHLDSDSEEEVQEEQGIPTTRNLPHRGRGSISSKTLTASPCSVCEIPKRREATLGDLLQRRELGFRPTRQLQSKLGSSFKLSKAWKGASNDVVTLTWSPDGTKFAAGAAAQCGEYMMAYNRKNNLLLGDLVRNELHELPDHWVQRPRRRDSASQVISDPRLFMSVTSVQWFEDTLYTASYDHTVKLWDTSRGEATCLKTLEHESKVIVMARSNFAKNILATGTNTIGFWNTETSEYTPLELPRARSRKDIELVSTSVAWGTNQATKDYLLAGMSQNEDGGVAQHGLLAAFRIRESSTVPEYFSPNSQNVFDVTWHPALPTFATACTAGQQASRGTRSVVNLYEPLRLNRRVMELECPALDMNEVVFCPMDTNYISAGCTDGITYVWDQRKPGEILHKLKHGDPLNQLDETIGRELADTGVNLQLWGNTYDQLYTGASDGVVKRWDILRAPEDVFIGDVVVLPEGIMCGALSPDKSNLLIGDVSGGVNLLSNSPFTPEKDTPGKEDHEFIFRESVLTSQPELGLDSGVKAARELILSGQIAWHPVFGPGQGPRYRGPFAHWARPDGTPPERMAVTRLTDEYEARQLGGVPPKYRKGLSHAVQKDLEAHITLAKIRNQRRGENKRRNPVFIKQESDDAGSLVDLCSEDDDDPAHEVASKRRQQRRETTPSMPIITNIGAGVIDLTGDSDAEESTQSSRTCSQGHSRSPDEDLDGLEDDFWWPPSSMIDPNWPKEF
ncbi:WD repeat protein [Aspergillus lucknowensis]|uniref:WD40-repeat-containing domain protein n=1 Tax=Aspergillus lucknowensis TaxID=176173 RepID=A0ABR4LFZ6_9EURO